MQIKDLKKLTPNISLVDFRVRYDGKFEYKNSGICKSCRPISDTTNLGQTNETITLYAKWGKIQTEDNSKPTTITPLLSKDKDDENKINNESTSPIRPSIVEKPEYNEILSTNTPVNDNGELILPPTHNKEEYTQPIFTNTPVDKDGNLILPPIVEIPEYKDDIVNEPQKDTKEPQQSQNNNKQILTEIYHQSDKKQDVINNNIEAYNNKVVQKQALPKTNALNSSVYMLGLLLSAIGLKHNKKD